MIGAGYETSYSGPATPATTAPASGVTSGISPRPVVGGADRRRCRGRRVRLHHVRRVALRRRLRASPQGTRPPSASWPTSSATTSTGPTSTTSTNSGEGSRRVEPDGQRFVGRVDHGRPPAGRLADAPRRVLALLPGLDHADPSRRWPTTSRSPRDQVLLLGPNPGGVDWLSTSTRGSRGVLPAGEPFPSRATTQSTPGCGIVIYRIDETVTPSNFANSDEDDPLIAVMQADGLENLESGDNRGDAGDSWPGFHRQARSSTTRRRPNTKFHDSTPSNLVAARRLERLCDARCTLDVTHLGDASPPVVLPAQRHVRDVRRRSLVPRATSDQNYVARHGARSGEPKPAGAVRPRSGTAGRSGLRAT